MPVQPRFLNGILHKHTHVLFREYSEELRELVSILPDELDVTRKQIIKVLALLEDIRKEEKR